MTRLIPLLALFLAVSSLHAEDLVLEKSATAHPVITLKEGQTLRGADPNARPVVSGIVLAKNVTVSGIDVAGPVKGGSGDIIIENCTIRGAETRGIDIDGASRVTIRNVQIINSATRNGVSAESCTSGNPLTACNASLFLQNDGNVSLENVLIDGSAQLGIAAENIDGLRMTGVEVKNAGNEPNESSVILRNPAGDVVFSHCNFHDAAGRELVIESAKGDVRVRIDHSTFTHSNAQLPAQALLAEVAGDGSLSIDITASTFTGGTANGVHALAAGHGRLTLRVAESSFDRNAGAIVTGASANASLDYTITGNHIHRSALAAIDIVSTGSGVVKGTIAKNAVAGAEPCGGCGGIRVVANMHGQLTSSIDDNTIEHVEGDAVRVLGSGNSDVRISVTKNRAAAPIHVQAGTLGKDTATICAEVRDNTTGTITLWNRFPGTTMKLSGFAGDPKSTAAVAAYLGRINHGAKGEAKLTTDPAGNAFAPGEHCVTP